MMFNIKIMLIIITILIRLVLYFFFALPDIRWIAMGEKLLCPPAPTFLHAYFCVPELSRGVL
jgi:hypothetical protein